MSYDELVAQYGTPTQAARAVATGEHSMDADDYMSWPPWFHALVSVTQGQLILRKLPEPPTES